MKQRIDDQISWYGKKSRQNKFWYRRLRILSIIVSLSIPILTGFIGKGNDDAVKLTIAVAGALVAFIEGLMSLNKYHDLWTTYRATGEGLKFHRYLFEAGAPPYDTAKAYQLFVQNAEALMASEHANWVQIAAEKPATRKETPQPEAEEETPAQLSPGT